MMVDHKQIECVIMDWAGTAVDFGCFAPVNALIKAFAEIAIDLSTEEVREPMGVAKMEHIRRLLRMERICHAFKSAHHRNWNEEDVVTLNQSFEKSLFATLTNYTDPLPHVIDTIALLRQKGIKIGSTTGYTRAMMDVVEPAARLKGYFVDNCITPDGLPMGRPAPFMIFKNMIDLNVQDIDRVIKVGDTMEDIREGLNAKAWTVGIIIGSSELGLSEAEVNAMPKTALNERIAAVRRKMTDGGAHYVIDSLTELHDVVERINPLFSTT